MSERGLSSSRYRNWALGSIGIFLALLLMNSFRSQSGTLGLGYFPSVPREDEPFMVTVLVKNMASEPHTYRIRIFVDGVLVLRSQSRLNASMAQFLRYTRASPKLGSAVRVYAEATNLETGERYSDTLLIPPSPPEVWMSFASFASFATSLSSTSSSAMFSSFAIRYYIERMSISMPSESTSLLSPINVGLTISITLIGLVMFLVLTDPSYGKLGGRLTQLRSRYGLLALSLFLIFVGIMLTRLVMIIGG